MSTATNNTGLLRSLSCLGHRIEQRFLEAEARVYAKEGRAAPPCKADSSQRPSLALLMRCWLASQSSTPSSPTSNVAPKAATAPVMSTQGGVWPRLQPTSFLGQVRYGILPLGRRWQLVGFTVIAFGLSSVILRRTDADFRPCGHAPRGTHGHRVAARLGTCPRILLLRLRPAPHSRGDGRPSTAPPRVGQHDRCARLRCLLPLHGLLPVHVSHLPHARSGDARPAHPSRSV